MEQQPVEEGTVAFYSFQINIGVGSLFPGREEQGSKTCGRSPHVAGRSRRSHSYVGRNQGSTERCQFEKTFESILKSRLQTKKFSFNFY